MTRGCRSSRGRRPAGDAGLDQRYLTVLKELGAGAVHPNDGDVTRQAALDDALVRQVEATFVALLNRVYEAPAQESERIAALEAARDRLTAPRVDRS